MKTYEEIYNELTKELEWDYTWKYLVTDLNHYGKGFADTFRCYCFEYMQGFYMTYEEMEDDFCEDCNVNDNYFYFCEEGIKSTNDEIKLYRENTTEDELIKTALEYINEPYFEETDIIKPFYDLIRELKEV